MLRPPPELPPLLLLPPEPPPPLPPPPDAEVEAPPLLAVLSCDEAVAKTAEIWVPVAMSVPMATTEMKAKTSAYSASVWPLNLRDRMCLQARLLDRILREVV